MKIRKIDSAVLLLRDMETLLSEFADMEVQCKDGKVMIPRLLVASLCTDTYLLDSLAELEDCSLILPHATIRQVRDLFNLLLSGEEIAVRQDTLDSFFWVDWTRWTKTNDATNITKSIIDEVVQSLPLKTIVEQRPREVLVEAPHQVATKSSKRPKKSCQCPICGKSLYDKHSLRKHEDAVHFNIRNYGCDYCPKRFSVRNDLRDHVQAVHAKIKACICDICGLALSTRHGLRTHKLVHQDNSKSISCPQCSKSFRHVCTYRKHIARVHEFSQEKRLKCQHCGKFYNHKEGLKRHVTKFHSQLRDQFQCNICPDAFFAFNYDLNRHMRRFHAVAPNAAAANEVMAFDFGSRDQVNLHSMDPQGHLVVAAEGDVLHEDIVLS